MGARWGRWLAVLVLIAITWSLPARASTAVDSIDPPFDLSGPWRFTVGDDPRFADPDHDDGAWRVHDIPYPYGQDPDLADHDGFVWYRRLLVLSPEVMRAARSGRRLAVHLDVVHNGSEVFANGKLIGRDGDLDADPPAWDALDHFVYEIPNDAVGDDGHLLLAIRAYRSPYLQFFVAGGGMVRGPYLLGDWSTLAPRAEQARSETFMAWVDDFIVAAILVIISVFSLMLARTRREARGFVRLAGMSLCSAIFIASLYPHLSAYVGGMPTNLRLTYPAITTAAVLFVEALWPLLGAPLSRSIRALQVMVAIGPLSAAALMDSRPAAYGFTFFFFAMGLLAIATCAASIGAIRRRHPNAIVLGAGNVVFLGCIGVTALASHGVIPFVNAFSLGMLVLVVTMMIALTKQLSSEPASLPTPENRLLALESGAMVAERYRLDEPIGRGGMGEVWAAVHTVTGREVALKFIGPDRVPTPEMRERFMREARATSRVAHPGVVEMLDVLRVEDSPVLVMERLPGESLAVRLQRDGPVDIGTMANIMLQVVSAVGAAHAEGIIHRDLKPENVRVYADRDGAPRVKVLDFGIAKFAGADGGTLTRAGDVVGTPAYMAPEQCHGRPDIDHRADMWAIGVMIYELASGQRPLDGETVADVVAQLVEEGIPPLKALVPDAPFDVAVIARRLLQRSPDDRPDDLREVMPVLSRHASIEAPDFGPPKRRPPESPEPVSGATAVARAATEP